MNKIIFITGGSRSGKSKKATELALRYKRRGFIATAIPFDKEMKTRIKTHKKERKNKFITVEEPYNLSNAITQLEKKVEVIIIDCITVWLGNLLYEHGENKANFNETNEFFEKLNSLKCDIIIVTNEVGMGIIPENKLARNYRDTAGIINQRLAKLSTEAILMVSGIPIKLKG